jgi:multiple sugar transport system substrate-binding protein
MIGRRTLLTSTAAALAMPAIIRHAGAQSTFDWKRFKGQTITVSLTKNPRADRRTRRNSRR